MDIDPESISNLLLNKDIDDTIMNRYLSLVQTRSDSNPHLPKIKVMETYFFSSLQTYGIVSAQNYLKHAPFESIEFLVVPIHLPNRSHWALVIADVKSHCLVYFDSLYCDTSANTVLSAMKALLTTFLPPNFNVEHWNCYSSVSTQQTNMTDCGPFVLVYAEAISRRATIQIPDESKIRISIKMQLFSEKALPISSGVSDPHRPLCFLYPPRPHFSFCDSYQPIKHNPRKIIDTIQIDDSPVLSIEPSNSLRSSSPVLAPESSPEINNSDLICLRSYILRNKNKQRPKPFILKMRNSDKCLKMYPKLAEVFVQRVRAAQLQREMEQP